MTSISPRLTSLGLAVLLAVAGLGLAALIGLQAVDAWTHPPLAVSRLSSMEAILAPGSTPGRLAREEMSARVVIDSTPLDSSGYALLALLRERAGDRRQAEDLMTTANALNHRDNVADLWLLNDLSAKRRYAEAFVHADAILRRKYGGSDRIAPFIFKSLSDPAALTALGRILAGPPIPYWRGPFMDVASRGLKQPDGMIAIFDSIVKAGGSVEAAELSPTLSLLVSQGQYQQAYLLWLLDSTKPVIAKSGNIINGDFGDTPSAAPFNWSAQSGKFLIADASGYGRKGPALRLAYQDIGAPADLGQQLLVLAPGRYRLSGQWLTAGAPDPARVELAVVCANDQTDLASIAAPDTHGAWRPFSQTLSVPETCAGQWLRFRPRSVGDGIAVEAWFAGLSIIREGES